MKKASRQKNKPATEDPQNDAWEKLSSQEAGETLANRDVFTNQQLSRSKIERVQSKRSRTIVAASLGVFVAVVSWVVLSILLWGAGAIYAQLTKTPLTTTFFGLLFGPSILTLVLSLVIGAIVFGVVHLMLMRNLAAQNLMNDVEDINQYQGDQHIALPEEIVRKFEWFPDVGAHSNVQVSSMISHVMLKQKGLKKVSVARRADADILDEDGEIEYLEGEVLLDDEGEPIFDDRPLIDEAFGDALFDASGIPNGKAGAQIRRRFDATQIPYNPDGSDRDKQGSYATVAEAINADWTFPEYEVQRPAGAYLVDVAPVNTMVLAITRAGKGQTYIEPVIDMWLRERHPNNMVINDPKGELLVKHYVRATLRGFQVVQFNLINAMKTDIYNPLGLAADAAREGDIIKCAMYVESIADVFFPLDGGDDPFWANAANNAFKRVAYAMIDNYMEEERKLRAEAERDDVLPKVLETQVDEMWGRVTLYNCYQLFVQLSSKKKKSPMTELEAEFKAGTYGSQEAGNFNEELYELARESAMEREFLWNGQKESDLLALYFNATETLPTNSIRTLIMNANNSLKSMGAAEKTISTVYGISITAMSFFTDPTIMRLTSGTPSQNTDLGGLSFPRRLGVRFNPNYLTREHLVTTQARWEAFADREFTEPLGKDFRHDDTVTPDGWARYYFAGKFEQPTAYLKLELQNPQTGLLIKTFHFEFTKDYQTSLSGKYYITDPVTGAKIVKNGMLVELRRNPQTGVFERGHTTYPEHKLTADANGELSRGTTDARAIQQTMVRYSENPKAVFLVTPPHLTKYAKLLLILIKQLVDLNFEKSYMTKSNQKPLFKTRFMLDELGNLRSEGHGIANFETMLSIGLGQEQQFTIILQTLQQLRDVYGDSVDKIVQGNASHLRSLIATPTGWQTMGETQVGDVILTPFGDRTEVTGVFPKGTRPVYRVTLRDGSSSEVCEQHLWQVECGNGVAAMRASEVIDTLELKRRVEARKQVGLPRLEPLDYDSRDLPVDPYVLGVILGDAGLDPDHGVVQFSSNDEFIIKELRRRGYGVTLRASRLGESQHHGVIDLGPAARTLNLAGKRAWEKSIPEEYLFGSVEQRLGLLRGLMDADGTINARGEMEFSSPSKALAEGVQALIRSLGGRGSVDVETDVMFTSPNQATPKAARDAYRVRNIRLQKLNPFLLPRKAERWVQRDDNSGNRVVSVEYVRDEPVQCISVADERHLYVMDDYMPTHNTSNIVFLKSTDDSMLDTLQKMSGTRHRVYRDSKTVTKDVERLIKFGSVEGKVSYTMTAKEEPVISYNDMAFLSERNSIVFRAGDAPVWNRNETIMPMSWRLFQDTIVHPGHEYTLQTIPTLSSVADYDVRRNQPDFYQMLEGRMAQAVHADEMKERYRKAYGYSEVDVSRLDPDVYSDEVMELINEVISTTTVDLDDMLDEFDAPPAGMMDYASFEDNEVLLEAKAQAERELAERELKRYAEGLISRADLGGGLDATVIDAYVKCLNEMQRSALFHAGADGSLYSSDGQTLYIGKTDVQRDLEEARDHLDDESARMFQDEGAAEEVVASPVSSWRVTAEFYRYLGSLASWQDIADGKFDQMMAHFWRQKEDESLRG